MKDKPVRYSRKAKTKLKDFFKKNKNLKEPLEEKMISPREEIGGWSLIFGYLGIFLVIAGVIMILPIFVMFFYLYEFSRILAFLLPSILSICVGISLSMLLKGKEKARLGKYQDLILLILIWIECCLVCSIPFALPDYIGGVRIGGLGLDYVHAIFETVSGFSTTGLTILEGNISPSNLLLTDGHCFLFYRSLIMFFGGIGFVLVLTCAISDTYGIKLYYSEGHTDRLLPNLYSSAKLILSLYSGIIIIGSLALYLGGMNEWTKITLPIGCENDPVYSSYFEALCTSICQVATGGFATRTLGIYAFNNVAIEIITEILMILGATNFIILYSIVTLKFTKLSKDLDVRLSFFFALILIPIIVIISSFSPSITGTTLTFNQNIRYSIYYFISATTTSGSANSSNILSTFSTPVLFLLSIVMAFGSQQGSTCGGIKMYRVGLTIKSIFWTIREKDANSNVIYPHFIYKYGEHKQVDNKEIKSANSYFILYFSFLFLITLLVAIGTNNKFDFVQCLFESSSALAGTGLSVGITSFNQNNFVLSVLTIAMFVGRLEIFPFIYSTLRVGHDVKHFIKNKLPITHK